MFILPNLFTVSSIFCGFYGAVTAAAAAGSDDTSGLYRACIAVLFAMIFDAVDGRVARLTRTQSAFGVQMDSLADVISFGAAPGLIAWHWGLSTFGTAGLLVCFMYCACGAIRLARFNVMAAADIGPSAYFLGLPIPAAAGLLVAVVISTLQAGVILGPDGWWAPVLLVGLGLLMVSNIRFRTFKATKMNKRRFAAVLAVFALVLVVGAQTRPSFAIVVLMGAYLAFGIIEESVRFVRRLGTDGDAADGDELDAEDDGPAHPMAEELLFEAEEELID
jgi:CDP-diacylglycerol--serine O-phosphatidyltransferase